MIDVSDFRTPGQLIEALLVHNEWTKRTLAIVLGVDDSSVTRMVSDKQPLTAPMALSLEEVFGISAEIFLALQKSYDLAKARITARPDPGRRTRAKLFGGLPVAELIKRRWIEATDARDIKSVEAALAKFFGVGSADQIEALPHAAKKTSVGLEMTLGQQAWLYRVKQIADDMLTPQFSIGSAKGAIEKLLPIRRVPEEIRKVPRILMEAGIKFVIVEALPSAKIDGVCFWLGDHRPVVALSMRHDRIDNFWFVLRHELEHVLQGHGKGEPTVDAELEGERAGTGPNIPEEERIANEAAQEFCVPGKMLDAFIQRKAPFFSERDLLGFSQTVGVHPGLIAGQLQFRTGRYDRFRNHLTKVRSFIAPSAIVDGWGDVAPVDF
jgi:HTH-type transcriptional regulator/antitoxin HigA